MAVYKVPQDVEADDKLLGPFSFRQFIYLIAATLGIGAAWGLAQIFVPLFVIPLPVILLFGALALPLRKDQPMEVYLAAIVSFYLKPRRRLWQPDGITSLVEVTAPRVVEVQRTKDLSQKEAKQRLSYLANVVDSGGWAVRGVAVPPGNSTPMNSDAYYEAQQVPDILDDQAGVARTFNTMIEQTDTRRRQQLIESLRRTPTTAPAGTGVSSLDANPYNQFIMQQTPAQPAAPVEPPTQPPAPAASDSAPQLEYDPYPTNIHQSVIHPLSDQPAGGPQPEPPADQPAPEPPASAPITTSEKPPSPDIINLANQRDLSIEAIAHEANRIKQKEESQDGEVIISLR